MESSVVSPSLQIPPAKKHKGSSTAPLQASDLDSAVDLLMNDTSLPPHLGIVLAHLLEIKNEYASLLRRNQELVKEMESVQQRNNELQNENSVLLTEIGSLRSQLSNKPTASVPISDSSPPAAPAVPCDETERRRSIVVSGVPENFSVVASSRVLHDFARVREIFDFLQVDCHPVCVYRMGRVVNGRPRLIKIVLPSSFFTNLILRRAPRLRTFSFRGIFIRPSLTKPERDRIRNARVSTKSPPSTADRVAFQPVISDECSMNVSHSSQSPMSVSPHRGNE